MGLFNRREQSPAQNAGDSGSSKPSDTKVSSELLHRLKKRLVINGRRNLLDSESAVPTASGGKNFVWHQERPDAGLAAPSLGGSDAFASGSWVVPATVASVVPVLEPPVAPVPNEDLQTEDKSSIRSNTTPNTNEDGKQTGSENSPVVPDAASSSIVHALVGSSVVGTLTMSSVVRTIQTSSVVRALAVSSSVPVLAGSSVVSVPGGDPSPPTVQSLWDRAYDTLKKNKVQLMEEYETLLSKEVQTSSPLSLGAAEKNKQLRQTQLDAIIVKGLQRMEEKKIKYTVAGHEFDLSGQITQAAGLVLWARRWIGEAVQASPEASVAWAGVCIILPLLTAHKTADEANRGGFTYVTTRMRYYAALEHLLKRLGQNDGVDEALVAETDGHLVSLYQDILAFQIQSVLRFYWSRVRGYAEDVFIQKNWKQMQLDIEKREAVVNADLVQINAFVTRQELENLNQTSSESMEIMQKLLSVSEEQLGVSRAQLGVSEVHLSTSEAQRYIAQKQLLIQQAAAQQTLADKQEQCLQLFRLTSSSKDVTYEWYKNRVEDRVQDTCMWFLQHERFQQWLANESGPLLVSADPGCGKSVLAKYLIDHELPARSTAGTTICYYFFKDQDQNTARQALCALLHQLFSQKPALIEHAMGPFRNDGAGLVNSTQSLWKIFTHAVHDPASGPTMIVLDALDECDMSEFQDLMWNVEVQFSGSNGQNDQLKILMTSRPYEQIVSQFQPLFKKFPLIHIPAEEQSETISQEVNRVIQYRVDQLAEEKGLTEEVKGRLAQKLLGVEHRTYLWVYLVFDYLKAEGFKKTTKGIEAAISTLPNTVNYAYEQILNKSKKSPTVRKILSIVMAAKRPLTLAEMNIAVNISETAISSPTLDLDLEDENGFKASLRSLCGLFVSVYNGNIYFLHQTAREFLLQTDPSPSLTAVSPELLWYHSITSRNAHTVLAEGCVLYLKLLNSAASLLTKIDRSDASSANRVVLPAGEARLAFLHYSAENWGDHLHEAHIGINAAITPIVLEICDTASKIHPIWSRIYLSNAIYAPMDPMEFTSLIAASFFGHDAIIQMLLDDGVGTNADKLGGRTALSWAAYKGHEAIVKRLLDAGALVNLRHGTSPAPLASAAFLGREVIVEYLINAGADIEAREHSGYTALYLASKFGQKDTVQLLLDHGANVEAKSHAGDTPIQAAAESGFQDIFELLIKAGAIIDFREDGIAGSPLLAAAKYGHTAIVEHLLQAGVHMETKDKGGQTALHWAVERRSVAVVDMLLKAGANIEAKNHRCETPFFKAPIYGGGKKGLPVMELLLQAGANIYTREGSGLTTLMVASSEGHREGVEFLLKKGVDMESKDDGGHTALLLAANKGRLAVVELLLKAGADIEWKERNGWTALMLASVNEHNAIVALLLEAGAQVESKDNYGRSALGWASMCREVKKDESASVASLLKAGADVEVKDIFGSTPLLLASRKPNEGGVKLLLKAGADVEAKDNHGLTALAWAYKSMHKAVTEILLEAGADTEAKDEHGRTALEWASRNGPAYATASEISEMLIDFKHNPFY